jgi:PAS domain S-box-containing protein
MFRSTKIVISFSVVLIAIGVLGMASYITTQRLIKNNEWVIQTHEVIENLGALMADIEDAETGQRGFILTGNNRYLEPYDQALGRIQNRLAGLTELIKDDPIQHAAVARLKSLADSKLDELRQTIELRRSSGLEAALHVVLSDHGKKIMDDIRELIAQMQGHEHERLRLQQNAAASTAKWTTWTIVGGIPLSLLVFAIAAIVLTRSGRTDGLIAGPPAETAGWQKIALRYLFAVAMAVLASFARAWLLKLGPMPLFITYYPAVLLVAIVSGGGPGIVTTTVSGLVALYYFVPPYGQISIESPGDVVALAVFSGTNLGLCMVAERLRRSRWAEAFGLAKQQEAEELAGKNEELAQQSEELSQQAEELAQQNEELQSQTEEIQSLNSELTGREEMLRKLLDAARLHGTRESVLREICAAAKDIFGAAASAVVICEKRGNELFIRAQAGSSKALNPWSIDGAFPGLVMQEGRTACLNDASLRPDLRLLQIAGEEPFQSSLSTPLRVGEELFGAVTIYSRQKQEWTAEQFRLNEWVSTQCGYILEILQLQDRLREIADQNRLLSELLECSEQPFGIGYPDGKLGFVNAAFERLTGYSRKELEGMDWANVLTPAQWRSIEQTKLEELLFTGQPARYEKEYVRKDGTHVPIELLVHLIKDGRGLPLYYYSFITDISERRKAEQALRQSEERFRLALRNAPVSVAVQDLDLRYIWAYNQQTGKHDDIVGKLDADIFPAGEAVHITTMKRRVIAESIELREQMWLSQPNGRFFFDVCWEPIKDEAGKIIGVGSAMVDVTAIKLAEETLARANDELEGRVAERTDELARRAGQLRALAGELTLSEQRERSRLAKVLHDHLQQLLVAAKFRLAILSKGAEDLMRQAIKEVEELLDESIASSRSLTAELSPPILHEAGLNAGLEWLARRMGDRHGLLVDLELEEIGPLPDDLKVLLFESVRELLFNVAKHAHTRSAVVNVKRVDGELQLAVSDHGAGFDPGVVARAGESGKGFGLFTVRERLELFGGRFEIQSTPGTGSRIFLSVPMSDHAGIQPEPAPATVMPGTALSERAPSPVAGRKTRVLLADDHAMVRQGIGNMISGEPDIEVVGQATDGGEAVELASKLLPDVILMDMSMPKVSGIEATGLIHALHPEIRIIGLSMFEETESAQAMCEAGAVCYLTKSGAAEALIAAIRNHGARHDRPVPPQS